MRVQLVGYLFLALLAGCSVFEKDVEEVAHRRTPPFTDCYEPKAPQKPTPLEDAMKDRDALTVALRDCRARLRKVVEEWPK